jgi:hypothetical protein
VHVRPPGTPIPDIERSIPDRDSSLALLGTGKGKMENGVEPPRLVRLEHVRHEPKQAGNRARPEPVGHRLYNLIFGFPPRHRFGIRAWDDINRLGAFLQRPHHLPKVALLVVKVGADHVFAGRTHRHAVGGL